ncbi:MAG: RNA-binding protein [Nitrospinota bacterium]|nr:RNA-binding protein [Nitrospinota bacterium]MDH4183889.1 RNA-binding protein [Nitrospinota bacterium]
MNIYVGNLPFSATENTLRALFEQYGDIQSIKIISDRETGRSKGFGFIEMDNSGADAAIKSLNNTDLDGRKLTVNQSEPRKSTSSSRKSW